MPTFDTPEPIEVILDVDVGDLRIVATDRADTVVEVLPTNPAKGSDVAAAERTTVEYEGGSLVVRTTKTRRRWAPWGGGESVDVRIELPAGSRVDGTAGVATLRCAGRIGECRYRAGVGDIRLEAAGPVVLKTGVGDVIVDAVAGMAEVTAAGSIRIGRVEGPAVVRNRNGDTWIGEVAGDARVKAANGRIEIESARDSVVAKTANGDVRIGEVERGAVVAQSACGALEVGVRDGVAAWLELETKFGSVQSDLGPAGRPGPGEAAVEVHATTSMGSITIRRSFARAAGRTAQ